MHIWHNESNYRKGIKDGNNLELTHGINGIRNTAKNKIQEIVGGRKDYKIDCLAADFKDWEISWGLHIPPEEKELEEELPPMLLGNPLENWIPISEIMKILNYTPKEITALLKDDSLKVVRVGNRKFVTRKSFAAFLEKKKLIIKNL